MSGDERLHTAQHDPVVLELDSAPNSKREMPSALALRPVNQAFCEVDEWNVIDETVAPLRNTAVAPLADRGEPCAKRVAGLGVVVLVVRDAVVCEGRLGVVFLLVQFVALSADELCVGGMGKAAEVALRRVSIMT